MGVDETSVRRHHDHISVFFDLEGSRILSGTKGKDDATMVRFTKDLVARGSAEAIDSVSCDLSNPYGAAVKAQLPDAAVITFDRYDPARLLFQARPGAPGRSQQASVG